MKSFRRAHLPQLVLRNIFPAAVICLFSESSLFAEQWSKSDSAAWSNAASWTDSVAGAPAPPGVAGGIYTDVRLNFQGGTTLYSATEGIQTYNVSGTGGETRGLFMSNTGGANSTLTMTGGELIFVQDGANSTVGLANAAFTATINLNGGKITINETDTNGDTLTNIGFGGGGTGVINVNNGGALTSHLIQVSATGTLNLNSGGLVVTNRIFDSGGTSTFVADGGTIQVRSASTGVNLIDASVDTATINAGGLTIDTAGSNASINKGLGGTGALTKSGAGTLTIASGASSFTGNVAINSGSVTVSTNGTATTSGLGANVASRNVTVASGATLNLTANDVFFNGGTARPALIVNGSLAATRFNSIGDLTLNGATLSQSSTDGVANTDAFLGYQFSSNVTVGGTALSSITTGNGKANHLDANTVFTVANATAGTDLLISAPLTNRSNALGNGGLTKEGAGTMELTVGNVYDGMTTINAGLLLVNNTTGSGTGLGNVLVNNNGTLGGTGSLSGSVTLNAGSTISPGASIESLATGNNLWNGGANFIFEFSTDGSGTAGTNYDLLQITGTLDMTNVTTGSPITLRLVSMLNSTTSGSLVGWNPNANHIWSGFVTTTGLASFASDKFSIDTTGFANPLNGSFNVVSNGNNLDLVYVTAIPEPGTWALLFASASIVCIWRRRDSIIEHS